jgi:hypothetical protein
VGGSALVISPFLPWVDVILLGNLNLFQLFEAAGHSDALAWGAILGGGASAFVGWREGSSKIVRATGLGVGILGGLLAFYALGNLRHEIREIQGLASVGIGPYIALAGCIAMVVGALMARDQRS